MKQVTINGRKYPFLVSAENALMHLKLSKQVHDGQAEIIDMIKGYTDMIRQGLKDGRYALPLKDRFYFIPSKKRLRRVMPVESMANLVNGEALPEIDPDKQEEEVEKKS